MLLLPAFVQAQNQTWKAPAEAKQVTNPVTVNDVSKDAGLSLYQIRCKSCHGDVGQNNPLKMVPQPPDLASANVLAQADGELFYKMSEGRGAMASYKTILSEVERWNLIAYIRSFDPNFVPTEVVGVDNSAVKNLQLNISTDDKKNIIVKVTAAVDTSENAPIAGVPIGIYVKRTFGLLRLSEQNQKTNSAGILKVAFPADLPGDSAGYVDIIVRSDEPKKYVLEEKTERLQWGTPHQYHDLLAERVMWGTRANAPLWIIFLYLGITGGAWLTIFYVVSLLLKIIKAGKK